MSAAPPQDLPEGLIEALVRHAAAGAPAVSSAVAVSDLAGGFVSPSVRRIDLSLALPDGSGQSASYVLKACTDREAAVMAAIADLGAASFPACVASGEGWFAAPFYPGRDLSFGDPAPLSVVRDLARLHAAWADRAPPPGLWTYDADHLAALLANALEALDASPRFAAEPRSGVWRERLGRMGRRSALLRTAGELPRTLVHGDVHPGNFIAIPDGRFVLIDWGNASHAPAALDIANTVPLNSPGWFAYLEAYRAAGGGLGEDELTRAWHWARGVGGLMYIPWTAQHRDDSARMIAQTLAADAALAGAIGGPLG